MSLYDALARCQPDAGAGDIALRVQTLKDHEGTLNCSRAMPMPLSLTAKTHSASPSLTRISTRHERAAFYPHKT